MFKYWLKQGVKLFTFFFNRLAISWGSNRTDHGSVSWGIRTSFLRSSPCLTLSTIFNFLHSFNDLQSFLHRHLWQGSPSEPEILKALSQDNGEVDCFQDVHLSNTQWSGVALGRPKAGVGVHREGPEPREHPEEPRRLSSQRPGAWAGAEGVAGDLGLCRQDQAAFSPTDCVEGNAMEALNNMYCYHNY